MTTSELLRIIREARDLDRVLCVLLGGFANINGCRVEDRRVIMTGTLETCDVHAHRIQKLTNALERFPNMEIEFWCPEGKLFIAKATPADNMLVLSLRPNVEHAQPVEALVA